MNPRLDRVPELDGIRAIAILAILVFHAIPGLLPGAFLGVDLFLVLSGYLITSLLIAEEQATGTVSLREFYRRRALRILPPLAAAIVLAGLLGVGGPMAALKAILFPGNLFDRETLGGLAHTWSLAVEEHFYLLWPVTFVAFPRRRIAILVGTVLIAIALRGIGLLEGIDREWLYQSTPTRIDGIAIGCLAAIVPLRPTIVPGTLVLGLGFLYFQRLGASYVLLGYTVVALACAPAMRAKSALLRSPILRYIGTRSYGLYLYHWPIYYAIYAPSAVKVAATFVIAEISYQTIERWARMQKSRRRADAIPPAASVAIGASGEDRAFAPKDSARG